MGANIFGKKFPLCILLWDLYVYDKIVIFKFFSSQIFKNYHFYHKVFCQIELKLESTSQKNKYMFKGILVYFLILNKLGQITLCAYLDLCVHLFIFWKVSTVSTLSANKGLGFDQGHESNRALHLLICSILFRKHSGFIYFIS